jgi:uncharacterized membrane-anchored protein
MSPLAKRMTWALALLAAIQTGVLGVMVFDRLRLLTSGREITLPIVPVDPRDLFRGEYVELGFAVGRIPAGLLDGPLPSPNAPFFVTLDKAQDGTWTAIKLSRDKPQEAGPDRVVLKGRSRFGRLALDASDPNAIMSVRYGIEQYFVPEGEGPRLEALARDKKLAALIAVDGGGNAAIKGILIDGRLQYLEPLL